MGGQGRLPLAPRAHAAPPPLLAPSQAPTPMVLAPPPMGPLPLGALRIDRTWSQVACAGPDGSVVGLGFSVPFELESTPMLVPEML